MTDPLPILRLLGVGKSYGTPENPLTVLRDVTLTVERGEYVTIIGPSGAGKSTLLNILGCLDRPTAGRYELLGENVAGFDDHTLSMVRRTRIGFVFQAFQLVQHLTVRENVELPMFYSRIPHRQRRTRALELIARVGLAKRAEHVPSKLSGGEMQRVAIARAMANNPAMILADEPTGNLDTATSHEIMHLLLELHQAGSTIVLITHNVEIAAASPRCVTLRDGVIASDLRAGREVAA
ncbi:MAG: ABC transporter ATP-binding protein [Phycisphaerae bacterium]|jgi:putative ABC transport system ATP-binding protein|nr:ABC transporter ATP-binding protein [Phycisphaerae bacterium]